MTSRRRLRSSASHRLEVPPARFSTVDKRAFPVDTGANIVERASVPHHICTVTRSLQTASQDFTLLSFSPRHPDTTYLLFIIIIIFYFFLAFPVQLAIIDIYIFFYIKHVDDDDDEEN